MKKSIRILSDIDELERLNYKCDKLNLEKINFATEYFKRKYPGLEEENYVFCNNNVFKITKVSVYEYSNKRKKNPIERQFHFFAAGVVVTANGLGHKGRRINELSYSVICTKPEYDLLVKRNQLPKKPKKVALLKLLKKI